MTPVRSTPSAPHGVLTLVAPRVSIIEDARVADLIGPRDGVLWLMFERRIRYRDGRGCWRDWRAGLRTRLHLPPFVALAIPSVTEWTPDTLAHVLTIARAQLQIRGARGRCRLTADVDSSYLVNVITLVVRVGDLRTTIRLEAGTIRFAVPAAVVAGAAATARPSSGLRWALQLARERTTGVA